MGRHLAPAAGRVGGRAYGLQHHLLWSDAQRQAQGAVAVIGEKPVVAGPQRQRRTHLQRFVPRAGNLKKDLLLPLEKDFAVVDTAGESHQPVDFDLLPWAQIVIGHSR